LAPAVLLFTSPPARCTLRAAALPFEPRNVAWRSRACAGSAARASAPAMAITATAAALRRGREWNLDMVESLR
jgi:hypothetical protein